MIYLILLCKTKGIEIVTLDDEEFFHSRVIKDFEEFKLVSDVIVTNRFEPELQEVEEKVYTRDIFKRD